jgi:hypothetical protein
VSFGYKDKSGISAWKIQLLEFQYQCELFDVVECAAQIFEMGVSIGALNAFLDWESARPDLSRVVHLMVITQLIKSRI